MERPIFVEEGHLKFLDKLRDSGVTNMWGARPYLLDEFPGLSEVEAQTVLLYWMKPFQKGTRTNPRTAPFKD